MSDIKLLVNHKNIPLKEIIGTLLSNITIGFVSALRGVPEDIKTVKLEINLID